MLNRITTALALSLILTSTPGMAVGDIVKDIAKKAADAAFSEAERQAIEKYYEVTAPYRGDRTYKAEDDDDNDSGDRRESNHKQKDKGKGNNRNKSLPKGISKKLERGGTLPPGIAKRYLPGDLERQLPPTPAGYERIEADGQVLLRNLASGVIADIINVGMKTDREPSRERTMEDHKTRERNEPAEKSEKKWWQFWKD